jgi:hypothetical protein
MLARSALLALGALCLTGASDGADIGWRPDRPLIARLESSIRMPEGRSR